MKDKISIYIIGNSDLTLECAQLALQEGFILKGIISSNDIIQEWCSQHQIISFNQLSDFKKCVLPLSFDYLFSIVNYNILEPALLEYPKYLAINYHDSLLPKYAGLNATSWVILNNEISHGVTWHVIDKGIDTGDILEQKKNDITPAATAFSLNLECYQLALETFSSLLKNIRLEKLERKKQSLSDRTYYSSQEMPQDIGLIHWDQEANKIFKLYRGTYFGEHPNSFCKLKVLLNKKIYYPRNVELTNDISKYSPGIVTLVADTYFHVSTQTVDVKLSKLTHRDGSAVNLLDLTGDICKGKRLPILKKQELDLAKNCYLNVPRPSAVRKVQDTQNLSLNNNVNLELKELELQGELFSNSSNSQFQENIEFILALILSYSYKIGGYTEKNIFYYNLDQKRSMTSLEKLLFDKEIPLLLPLDPSLTPEELTCKLRNKFAHLPSLYPTEYSNRSTCCLDVVVSSNRKKIHAELHSKKNPFIGFLTTKNILFIPDNSSLPTASQPFYNNLLEGIKNVNRNHKASLSAFSLKTFVYNEQKLKKEYTPIITLFNRVVKLFPNKIAIESDGSKTSYAELERKSNSIANILLEKKLPHNSLIAISLGSSVEMIITMIAVLKVGHAYLPIDIEQPQKRVSQILADSKSRLLVTSKELFNKTAVKDVEVCYLPTSEEMNKHADAKQFSPSSMEDLAYVIYTSGSTGESKGVKITNKNIAALFFETNKLFDFNETDKWTLLHSVGFDFSVWEIWGALLHGATLHLIPNKIKKSPKSFSNFITRKKITVLNITPSYFSQISKYLSEESISSLRYVIFGGEKLGNKNFSHIKTYRKSNTRFINMYGITEISIHGTLQEITYAMMESCDFIPIGKPLPHLNFFLLDRYNNLLPSGVQGEIFVCGDSVSPGYINENLTVERFFHIPNLIKNTVFYKTGDLAFLNSSSQLEYIARKDQQIKFRGYRIELGEIDKNIMQHPNVTYSHSILSQNKGEQACIVSYFLTNPNSTCNDNQLRAFLEECLPTYMLPNLLIKLDRIPFTLSGKIDHKQLPTPNEGTLNKNTSSNSTINQTIRKIWATLLMRNDFSDTDSFFDVGGHSLLITKMIMDLNKEFKMKVPFESFFHHPTIKGITNLIELSLGIKKKEKTENHTFNKNNLDYKLDLNIREIKRKQKSKNILLTGASGLLGIFLLRDLSSTKDFKIYCLIRDENLLKAKNRISRKYESIFSENLPANIEFILGDLARGKLGLNNDKYKQMSCLIDTIVHTAAHINHLSDYDALESVNVQGTRRLLDFAAQNQLKAFHYISTLSAGIPSIGNNKITEEFQTSKANTALLSNGYSQSKWHAEMLVSNAHLQGVPANIYRPPWIIGDQETTYFEPENNHLFAFISTCIELNKFPQMECSLSVIPVNVLSKSIASCVKNNQAGMVANFSNLYTIGWKEIIQHISKESGPKAFCSYASWRKFMLKNISPKHCLYKFLPFYIIEDIPYLLQGQTIPTENITNKVAKHLVDTTEIYRPDMTLPNFLKLLGVKKEALTHQKELCIDVPNKS